jgi:aminomethyltransferase
MMEMAAARRPRVREPGIVPYIPGLERYRARGGGCLTVSLGLGDRLTLIDVEGGQRCEVVAFAPAGGVDATALGAAPDGRATGIAALIGRGEPTAAPAASLFAAAETPAETTPAHVLFDDPLSPAGTSAAFVAERAAVVVVAAPGGPLSPHDLGPATDILALVERAQVPEGAEPRPLPPPLAEPVWEGRVPIASAIAYTVEKGQYIQIIDVDGRQCSDFQAFDRRALDRGVELELDSTTTRTLLGMSYPVPGLLSKMFDREMNAAIEVIQDTCGRHDSFGLACTRRYYEDMGYFGHPNCTDNFNTALRPYGVAPRRGWPALNLFFNTSVDATNAYHGGESWSRPGDYVLIRALNDLVCASSACPDDIDPANGWNLSEIHVRIYPAEHQFRKAVAYRMTPDSEAQLTRETGFHPRTSALTRNFVEYRGYWLPTKFNNYGREAEYWACREGVVVMDLSPLRKFDVMGPDAESLMQYTLTRNVKRIAPGAIAYTAMCNETGGMLDDGTLFRMGPDNFRWICGDEYSGVWLREQARINGWRVQVKSATDQLHNIAVQGPKSLEVLRDIIWTPPAQPTVEEIEWFRFTIGRIGGWHGIPVMVSRTGYTGERGYEIWCHPSDAPAVWDAVWEAGQPHRIAPMGLEALDVVRIESGLIFYGYEFCDQTDPFEAGIGFTVGLNNEDDFIGKAALVERKAHPQRVLVGLEVEGDEPAVHGDCVHIGRAQVGVVTSGCRSPILGKTIALCRIAVQHSAIGTEVEIGKLDGHQKRIPATVVRFPFYDPEKKRPRGLA